jgi:hypothetical protein
LNLFNSRLRLKCDGTRAETRFRLSAKRTSPFKSVGAAVQSTTGSRGVGVSGSNAGYTMFRVLATHSIRQFPLHFPSRASPCAVTFQLDSTPQIEVSRNTGPVFVEWHYSNYGVRDGGGGEKGVLFNDTSITVIL